MIQRTYEHGNAFYDFKLKDMYLDKMGVKLGWAKGKDGSLYNIVENATGSRKWVKETEQGIYNEFIGLFNQQDYKSIRNEIENFMPNENYLPKVGKLTNKLKMSYSLVYLNVHLLENLKSKLNKET